MSIRSAMTRLLAQAVYGTARAVAPEVYAQDGIVSVHNHEFMHDDAFVRAYARGIAAIGGRDEYHWHWRIHIGLWAAVSASKLQGDFVECGVNRGFLSSAVMQRLAWDSTGKMFYLLDTFAGLDPRFVSSNEIEAGALEHNRERLKSAFYVSSADDARKNFAEWRNVKIVVGSIPDTLAEVPAKEIAYLHLDMNCAPPEVAAIEHFWDRLVPGAFILLDDYAYYGCRPQKVAMDAFAASRSVAIASLPTGQGLIIRPPR